MSTVPEPLHAAPATPLTADLVIAATGCSSPAALPALAAAAREAIGGARRALVCHTDAFEAQAIDPQVDDVRMVAVALPPPARLPLTPPDGTHLIQTLAQVCQRADASACTVVGTPPDAVTSDALRALTDPILGGDVDLVLPAYARHRLDGLIHTGIVAPLTRALYGRRIDGQLGLDFAMSRRMLDALAHVVASRTARTVWPLSVAIERGLATGQARLGAFLPPIEQASDLSTALAGVLGGLFEDVERRAPIWQRIRGSQAVPVSGTPPPVVDDPRAIDIRPMIESFRVGVANLREVWGLVLPPASLVELNRLARAPVEAFRMPDALWARVVFDFAVGHRLRVITREHLLRAMTPAYLGWAASFASEVAEAPLAAASQRVERLGAAFEAEKPYLLARWRWPDRFQP